jgi:pyruvate carboxylase
VILRGDKAYTDRPNAHLDAVDFDKGLQEFEEKFPSSEGFLDYLSYLMYPKVFEDFYKAREKYGDASIIPTHAFWYGLKQNEEILIQIDEGKTILVRYLYSSEPDEEGKRTVSFELNGQTRRIKVRDNNEKVTRPSNQKVQKAGDVGAPLQGRISRIMVNKGDEVAKNAPLFVIEAMKMESIVASPIDGTVTAVMLSEGSVVEQDDWVVEITKD